MSSTRRAHTLSSTTNVSPGCSRARRSASLVALASLPCLCVGFRLLGFHTNQNVAYVSLLLMGSVLFSSLTGTSRIADHDFLRAGYPHHVRPRFMRRALRLAFRRALAGGEARCCLGALPMVHTAGYRTGEPMFPDVTDSAMAAAVRNDFRFALVVGSEITPPPLRCGYTAAHAAAGRHASPGPSSALRNSGCARSRTSSMTPFLRRWCAALG